jgi:hypothetical protein
MTPNELLEYDIAGWEHQISQTGMPQLTRAVFMTVLYVAKAIWPQKSYSSARGLRCVHRSIPTYRCFMVTQPQTLKEGKGSGESGHNPWSRERNLSVPMRLRL